MNTPILSCSLLNTFMQYTVGDPQTFWAMVQALGLVLTLWFIWWQIRLQTVSNALSSLAGIEQQWKSPEMAEARKSVCKCYKDGKDGGNQAAERVACFFETLGLYHSRKVFDSVLIWEIYSYYAENYWPILRPKIEKLRKDDGDPTIYSHFEDFYNAMLKVSKKRGAPTNTKPPEVLLAFADSELERK